MRRDVHPSEFPHEAAPQILEEGRRVLWQKQNPQLGKEYLVLCYH
jgi:hypothetical protein